MRERCLLIQTSVKVDSVGRVILLPGTSLRVAAPSPRRRKNVLRRGEGAATRRLPGTGFLHIKGTQRVPVAGYIREVKHHVYVKRQTQICTRWPSFLFTCRLLFIISTPKLVVLRNFLSLRIVFCCFYVLIFYCEKFLTWIWRLPFAVYVKLKLSIICLLARSWPNHFLTKNYKKRNKRTT